MNMWCVCSVFDRQELQVKSKGTRKLLQGLMKSMIERMRKEEQVEEMKRD